MVTRLIIVAIILLSALSICAQVATDTSAELPNLNAKAAKMGRPVFQPGELSAGFGGSGPRTENVTAEVKVRVVINEEAKVISAESISGPVAFRKACEEAAFKTEFDVAAFSGLRTTGILVWKFMAGPVPPPGAHIRANWINVGMMLSSLERSPTLRYANPEMLARSIPPDWIEEQNQISKIRGLKQAELQSSISLEPASRTLSDGHTKVISGPVEKTAPPEAIAIAQALIESLRSRLGARPIDRWHFELGLQLDRAGEHADSRDKERRMQSISPFKDFIATAPPEIDRDLIVELQTVYSLIEKGVLTDEDKVGFSREMTKLMNMPVDH